MAADQGALTVLREHIEKAWRLPGADQWETNQAREALALVEQLQQAAAAVTTLQQDLLETFRARGVVFKDIGNDPTNWQHVAFTAYSTLCEAEAGCRAALRAVEGQA